MNRYQKIFTYLCAKKMGAFVPFITIGDPNSTDFLNIIDTLILSGADALELGIPFSDPLSDGPSIQKSIQRSFQSGINFLNCLQLIKIIRNKYLNLPIGLLVYANLIFKNGINNFYKLCSQLDIDSILIPDLPIEESLPFYKMSLHYKIAQIFICPPNATINLIQKITNQGNGYIYLLSRSGVTGINQTGFDTTILNTLIQNIKEHNQILPILQGFGMHTALQARISVMSGTSGIIIGSAIADIIETNYFNMNLLLKKLKKLTSLMKLSMSLNKNIN